jgi:hypothetical protein
MFTNQCSKCGEGFETKNPKRVICPNCLYPEGAMPGVRPATPPAPASQGYAPSQHLQRPFTQPTPGGGFHQQQPAFGQQARPYPPQQRPGFGQQQPFGQQQRSYPPQQRPLGPGFGQQQHPGGFQQQRFGGFQQPRPNNFGPPRGPGMHQAPGQGFNPRGQGMPMGRPPGPGFGGRPGMRPGGFPPRPGGMRPRGFGPPRGGPKKLLVTRDQLIQIETLYKQLLPLPNPDVHEVIGEQINLAPSKVFFGINLVREKMKLSKLEYPKRKLAVTPEQLMAIETLYEPYLPLPPIGIHKIISKQLRMDEWRVHVAIGLIRKNRNMNRWNEDRDDLPLEMRQAQERAKLEKEQQEIIVAAQRAAEADKEKSNIQTEDAVETESIAENASSFSATTQAEKNEDALAVTESVIINLSDGSANKDSLQIADEEEKEEVKPKATRGRKPKTVTIEMIADSEADPELVAAPVTVVRRRGRPPKSAAAKAP